MRSYSDPTANAAIGAVDKEFREKKRLAQKLKRLRKEGVLTEEEVRQSRKQFTGVFSNLYFLIFDND